MISASRIRVAVAGGSLAGLTAAIMLRRAGAEVDVFERSRRPLEGRGAGIVLHPATVSALPRHELQRTPHVDVLRYLGEAGTVTHELECSYRFTSYFALHRALLHQFDRGRYHLGHEVTGFQQHDGSVDVRLGSQTRARYDLLVCADGIQSASRRRLLPAVRRQYVGYVGWRGTVEERALSPATFELLTGAISYCVVPHSHILVYPLAGYDGSLDAGRRLINWVWYRNVPEGPALDALLTDRGGVRQPVSLGAGCVRDDALDALRADAARLLPAALAEMIERSPAPFVQVVSDIAVPRMAFGRVALIGDAAFTVRPHIAAGTAKAAEDGITLARAVSEGAGDLADTLAAWERGRIRVGTAAMLRSRDAGVRAQFENAWVSGDPLPFGLHRDGDSRLP